MKIKIVAFLILVTALPAIAQQKNWKVERTIHIGGPGGWDYVTVNPQSHYIYVTRSTHTMVIDPSSDRVVADIPDQKRSHGVALAPKAGRGFISDGGGDGAIIIFDLKTNKILGTVAAQADTDGIIFDPSSGLVLAVSGDGGTLPAPIRVRGWRLAGLIWSILLFGTLSVLTFSDQIGKLFGG